MPPTYPELPARKFFKYLPEVDARIDADSVQITRPWNRSDCPIAHLITVITSFKSKDIQEVDIMRRFVDSSDESAHPWLCEMDSLKKGGLLEFISDLHRVVGVRYDRTRKSTERMLSDAVDTVGELVDDTNMPGRDAMFRGLLLGMSLLAGYEPASQNIVGKGPPRRGAPGGTGPMATFTEPMDTSPLALEDRLSGREMPRGESGPAREPLMERIEGLAPMNHGLLERIGGRSRAESM